ncbi:Thiol-disulfide isomerase or thioredoxin [Parapedobacter koreensis]|uniref:Thiol-disulfide isomerase or thioredoxin n=2 Tax=Parapedobacter koreensis TaxID=332977 RepID=A0A1H7RL06_9SPHI|nr:Thiol-disulfide isomerase or thioredoxin [Parapedobacter koreensis]
MFVSCFSREESKHSKTENHEQDILQASLSISLKPGERAIFNVFDVYRRSIALKNATTKDSLFEEKIWIDKPLLLVSGNVLVVPDGDPILRIYGLLLSPGDSVVLDRHDDGALSMHYSSGLPNFVDSLIVVPKDFYEHDGKRQQKRLAEIGVAGITQDIDAAFQKNETAIAALAMPEVKARLLSSLNSNIKYTAIAHLLADPAVASSGLTDSLYEDLFQHMDEIRSIDATTKGTIFGALIAYNAKKQHGDVDKTDMWEAAAYADQQLKQTDMYKQHLVSAVAGTFVHSPKEITAINKELQSIHTQDPFLDTLYQLTNILSATFTDFSQAKAALKAFAGGRYRFIIEDNEQSANHEMKVITDLPPVELHDFAGNKSDFKRIVMNKDYMLTLVDLWASWCVPCIMEMPDLKKTAEKFRDKPIRFLAISIDKEEDVDKWVAVAKKNAIYNKPNQYRLANFRESPLTKLLNIRNIPRYLVINNEGRVLDEDFYRPSESSFELELLKLLD